MFQLSADVGGTFVDLVLVDVGNGRVWVDKVAATQTSADGILAGISRICAQAGVRPADIARFVHGFTIATNAWLTRSGAKAVLVVTDGFRDVLEVGSQRRPLLYSLTSPRRDRLVPRSRVVEVRERVASEGDAVLPLSDAEIARVVAEIARHEPESVAISLLFSFMNPAHEARLAAAIRQALPGVPVYLSSEVNPQIQEYPRTNTVAASAYVGPKVQAYVELLLTGLDAIGYRNPLMLMRSDGGVATPEAAKRSPETMLLSGPAGGVIAAAALGKLIDAPDLITFDMGGTSADFALIAGSMPGAATDRTMNGQVLRSPMLAIETTSAGGGSIASVDRGGALRVGPDSAGSRPGPACYGLGGTQPTLTDAAVVLGIIYPDDFAGGTIRLDIDAARAAIERVVARPLQVGIDEAAWGMIAVSCAQMRQAIRALSVERGHDLRNFALLAFGGAGAIFGSIMLDELGADRLIIPPRPGVFAAFGLLLADISHTVQAPFGGDLASVAEDTIRARLHRLTESLEAALERDGVPKPRRTVHHLLDLRYRGQFHDITIPIDQWDPPRIAEDFHATHDQLYGHADHDSPIEITGLRAQGVGILDKPRFTRLEPDVHPTAPRAHATRRIVLDKSGKQADCPVFLRSTLLAGQRLTGPAVVSQSDTTILLLPGQAARVDDYGNLHITAGDAAR